jgi:CYTH domain-containing protein
MSELAGKYARFELERRFLVADLPKDVKHGRGWHITDRYITNTQLRLRRSEPIEGGDAIFKLGQKQVPSPPDFGRMTITNIYLSRAEYSVFANLEARELQKRRYAVAHNGRIFGVDVFQDMLSGLVLAETSFDTDEEMEHPLDLPSWIGDEVSTDFRFTGGALASLNPPEAVHLLRQIAPRQ